MILQGLNAAQQAAVSFRGGPLLILAGAGSGKTRVLTYRTAYLVKEEGVPGEDILLLTFTNKAAGEMLGRVRQLLGSEVGVMGGTFHGWCARILRQYAAEAGLDSNFVIFDTADQLETIKQAMEALRVDAKAVKPRAILGTISAAKNELIGPHDYANFARGNFQQTAGRVYLAYQQILKRYQAVDFDDLLLEVVKLLEKNPETLEKLQKRFKYILVDEYQDTNKAQYEITKKLAGKLRQLTVVGDSAQAIYSWRGADYRNLLALKSDFPDLTTINLEQNYRSTQTILEAANNVISKNKNHPVLKLWTDKGVGEKIKVYEAESELTEAQFVIGEIAGQMAKSIGRSYSEFAVLYRTNAQSRSLEEAFLHVGIPYSLVGGVRFYERKEIKDVLAYLQLLINPKNDVARKRATKNGKARLVRLEGHDFKITQTPALDILDKVLKVTGYIERFDELDEEDAARLENIKELRSVAAQFPALTDFLEQVALTEKEAYKAKRRQEVAEGGGAVTLMTMHAAKGLEFKTVFMVGMEEGLFPHSRALFEAEQMEEERRLAYVGMTRAMDRLYLTYARRRLYFGSRSTNPVSRFVADIPESYLVLQQPELRGRIQKAKRAGKLSPEWGFDAQGNWKWSPNDDNF